MNGLQYKKDLVDAFTGAELHRNSQFRCFLETLKECVLPPKQAYIPKKYRVMYKSPRMAPVKSMLQECLLTQQWEDATHVLHTAAEESQGLDEAVWKGGLEVLLSDPEANRDYIDDLHIQVSQLDIFEPDEIDLNQLLYLLADGRMEQALRLDIKGRRYLKREQPLDLLAEGYKGLIHFVKWLQMKASLQDPCMSQLSHAEKNAKREVIRSNMQHFKMFASVPFNHLIKHQGVWDIFVCAYVQMLEFHGDVEECEQYLEQYRDRNPDNPNAHRYLYQFLCGQGGDQDRKLQVLQGLLLRDPSNPLALDFVDLHDATDPAAIRALFDMLDFQCWQENYKPWKKLASRLRKAKASQELRQVVQECWQSRQDWWPPYHFPLDSLPASPSCCPRLLKHKASVARKLMGDDNYYSQAVAEFLSRGLQDLDTTMDVEMEEVNPPT